MFSILHLKLISVRRLINIKPPGWVFSSPRPSLSIGPHGPHPKPRPFGPSRAPLTDMYIKYRHTHTYSPSLHKYKSFPETREHSTKSLTGIANLAYVLCLLGVRVSVFCSRLNLVWAFQRILLLSSKRNPQSWQIFLIILTSFLDSLRWIHLFLIKFVNY